MDKRLQALLEYIKQNIYPNCNNPHCEIVVKDITQSTVTINANLHYWLAAPIRKFLFKARFKKLLRKLRNGEFGNIADMSIYLDSETKHRIGFFSMVYKVKLSFTNIRRIECTVPEMNVYHVTFSPGQHRPFQSEWITKVFHLKNILTQ